MTNKSENTKATNLILGAIYINGITGDSRRLVNIIPCQGVWLETYDGQGYGELVKFENVFYADLDQVQDFLDDLKIYNDCKKADKWNQKPFYRGRADFNGLDAYGDELLAHYDDDPSPYAGTYSEE
jgi:hypothetical protein